MDNYFPTIPRFVHRAALPLPAAGAFTQLADGSYQAAGVNAQWTAGQPITVPDGTYSITFWRTYTRSPGTAGQVALGLMYDAAAGRAAHEAGVGAEIELALGTAVPTYTGRPSDPPLRGRYTVRALGDGVCTLTGPMMRGLTVRLGPCACLEIEGVRIAVVGGKKQLLDRELLRMVGIHAERMRIIVVKSANHFRADFEPHASHVLVAKAAGPMAADPADLPWRKLPESIRRRP